VRYTRILVVNPPTRLHLPMAVTLRLLRHVDQAPTGLLLCAGLPAPRRECPLHEHDHNLPTCQVHSAVALCVQEDGLLMKHA